MGLSREPPVFLSVLVGTVETHPDLADARPPFPEGRETDVGRRTQNRDRTPGGGEFRRRRTHAGTEFRDSGFAVNDAGEAT